MSLSEIAAALRTVEGVRSADARSRPAQHGVEIVGFVTLDTDSALTPGEVIEQIRSNHPKTSWPDRVLLAFQAAPAAALRRAA